MTAHGWTQARGGLRSVLALVLITLPVTGVAAAAHADALPTASLTSSVISIREGAGGGLTPVSLTVGLSAPSATPVSVGYTTANGTAKASSIARDYVSQAGEVVFAPGETAQTITVIVNDDLVLEDFEYFSVKLTTSAQAVVSTTPTKVIIENDELPRLKVSTPTPQAEGRNVIFRVGLSHRYYLPIAVGYATAAATALPPGDYVATPLTPAASPFTIPAGTKGPVPVTVRTNLDNLVEPTETFSLTATSTSVTNSPVTSTGTIQANAT